MYHDKEEPITPVILFIDKNFFAYTLTVLSIASN